MELPYANCHMEGEYQELEEASSRLRSCLKHMKLTCLNGVQAFLKSFSSLWDLLNPYFTAFQDINHHC